MVWLSSDGLVVIRALSMRTALSRSHCLSKFCLRWKAQAISLSTRACVVQEWNDRHRSSWSNSASSSSSSLADFLDLNMFAIESIGGWIIPYCPYCVNKTEQIDAWMEHVAWIRPTYPTMGSMEGSGRYRCWVSILFLWQTIANKYCLFHKLFITSKPGEPCKKYVIILYNMPATPNTVWSNKIICTNPYQLVIAPMLLHPLDNHQTHRTDFCLKQPHMF